MQDVEMFHPRFELGDRPLGILGSRGGQQFQLDAEAALEGFFKLFAQNRGGRAAGNDFAFLLGRFDDAAPVLLNVGGAGLVTRVQAKNPQHSEHAG